MEVVEAAEEEVVAVDQVAKVALTELLVEIEATVVPLKFYSPGMDYRQSSLTCMLALMTALDCID